MSQLFGQPTPADPHGAHDDDQATVAGMQALPAAPNPEQALFRLDMRRSLQLHWRLARTVAIVFCALAVVYFLAQVFLLKSWPAYMAVSTVYVQPTPAKILPNDGARRPSDSNTYETYIQQQMMNVSREDVLIAGVHKLNGFEHPGESDQAAAERLVRALEVTRIGEAYQFSISARARDPQTAADIANAVTAAYIESASRDEQAGDAQRLAMLKEEKDRVQTALTSDRSEQDALNRQLGVASVSTVVPDHYDEDITQMRTELAKARTDHDEAESKFAALGAGHGATSAAIDAAADEMIASDAGLVSMKTALNARRATLLSQMANLTPANPQYKQDEAELTDINGTLDAMMKDLRAKAAARIQLQLSADLHRTGGVESQLNGQLRQLVGAATSATPKMQRANDLAADITRLQTRFAIVDEQLHDLMLEDGAPAAAYQVTPAVAPLGRTKSGVLRNAVLIVFAGLIFGILAAVLAHKLDPRIYAAADVEHALGFAPLAQLPNFNEVSAGAAEEYMLRLASAIEHGRKQGNLKNCIFTGTSAGTGVTTLVNRVGEMLEAMGRPTVLVDATGAQAPASRAIANVPEGTQALVPVERVIRPTALLQRMAEETETGDGSLVLTDTAPLAVSAETEYLARYVDCAIVVVEAGVTTRAELREAARTLQRLNVGAVGFVLNRVGVAKADPAFRASVEAVEKHLLTQSSHAARRTERSSTITSEPLPQPSSVRSRFEPGVAAAAAAVARFSSPPMAKAAPPAVCLASPGVTAPVAEAAKRFSLPLAVAPEAEAAGVAAPAVVEEPGAPVALEAVSAPEVAAVVAEEEIPGATPTVSAPFMEAAKHFVSTSAAAETGIPFSPRAVAPPASDPVPGADREPFLAEVAETEPAKEPSPEQELEPPQAAANPAAEMPWWLSDAPRNAEPTRPPVLWKPAKVWTSRERLAEEQPLQAVRGVEPPTVAERLPEALPVAAEETKTVEAGEEVLGSRNSRLSGLRNLLFVLGVKNFQGGADEAEVHGGGASPDLSPISRSERSIAEDTDMRGASVGGASPRLVTAPPEFLPPRPHVIEFDKADARVGESSTRQDWRPVADRVEILPSKRGQYKRL